MAEYVWLKNPTVRMAASRIVRYFLTKVVTEGIDKDQKGQFDTFLENRLQGVDQLALIGDDFMAYGNSMTSMVVPFRRYLKCKQTGFEQPIEKAEWRFTGWEFEAYVPKLQRYTKQQHIDRPSNEEDRINVKRWSPYELEILWHPWTQCSAYYWRIPERLKTHIRQGVPYVVKDMPWEVIETVKRDQIFEFNPDVVFHMREEVLCGVPARGWGVSRILSSFAQAWYVQVLKRYNEALALDYVIPFRCVTPAPNRQARGGDAMLDINISDFNAKIATMLRQHRRDPGSWHALPFPVEYQTLGGEAKELATPELLDNGMDELLNGMGIPAEMYRGTMQWQAMPTALRLFQQTWPHLVSGFNRWLEWMAETVCSTMNWDKPEKIHLQPVTLADDVEKKHIWLQLAAAGIISRQTALAPWGVDPYKEQEKMFDEQREFAEQEQEFQEDMEQRQLGQAAIRGQLGPQGAAGAAAGPPPMGGPQVSPQGMSPMDVMAQAEEETQRMMQMPASMRRGRLMELKNSNPTLHALVKQGLEQTRSQARSEGQAMVLQQAYGQA